MPPEDVPPLVALIVSAVLSSVLMPVGIRLAWSIGWLDHPEARKLHTSATAVLGGFVVFVAAMLGWLLVATTRPVSGDPEVYFLIGGAVVALVCGLWDDRYGMSVPVKLLGQFLAAGILLASGHVPHFGAPAWVEAIVWGVALVALMNAVNFLDNMNGMVAGYAAIVLAGFAWTSLERGANGVAAAQLALAGACVGFLPWNFPRARIFLGDAGSLFLGYSLGASAVLALAGAPPGWGRIGPLFGLAYPAFDMIFVVLSRLSSGRKVYQGGKDHTNHRLASVLCQTKAVLLLWLSGAALSASGLVVLSLNQPLPTLLVSALWSATFLWMGRRLSSVPPIEATSPSARS